jgi:hypothetical protein
MKYLLIKDLVRSRKLLTAMKFTETYVTLEKSEQDEIWGARFV